MNALKECTTVQVPVYSVGSLRLEVWRYFLDISFPLILCSYVHLFDISRANEGFY